METLLGFEIGSYYVMRSRLGTELYFKIVAHVPVELTDIRSEQCWIAECHDRSIKPLYAHERARCETADALDFKAALKAPSTHALKPDKVVEHTSVPKSRKQQKSVQEQALEQMKRRQQQKQKRANKPSTKHRNKR